MTVEVMIEDTRWAEIDITTLAETATDAALERVGLERSSFEISLLACDDRKIAQLNTDFRAKAQPTNVLSWPSDERGASADGETPLPPTLPQDQELGDIAIAFDTCEAEALGANKPMSEHVIHLIIHGTLHLLGYDHMREGDAALMEGLETEILGNLGVSDPYSR
ncbi:probable rRNA maturation factor [Cognatiyoonia koreensis]|uniref:Endoribonuclease YbeY n=1 Tax=Cognatiyoonia koreensis TaxID=364200 RepID=A0A1I0RAF5_9RHOB|nr:rRNA maturation RNase YbeY [Cognatiyoonia koreensis]SEW37802.1 probable rRNA maturation factor [Cognatiyoonia koreensis]